mgnify:CR=1 FL=1
MAKPKKAEQATTVVYCGPSIPGVAKQYTAYTNGIRAGGGYREAAGHGGPGGAPGAVTGGHEEPAERHGAYFPPVSSGTGQTLNRR